MYTINSSTESSRSELFALTKSFIKDNFAAISVIFLFFYGLESLIVYYSPRSNSYLTLIISTFVQYFFLNIFKLNQANIFPGANYLFTKKNENNQGTSLKDIFSTLFSYYWRTGLLTLLLVIPGIIFSIYWQFNILIAVDKHIYKKEALDYSKSLVKGHWWKVFSFAFLGFLFYMLTYILIDFTLGRYVAGFIPNFLGSLLGSAFICYFNITLMFFYLNLDQIAQAKNTPQPTESPLPPPVSTPLAPPVETPII